MDVELSEHLVVDQRLIQLDKMYELWQEHDARKADVMKLRFFAGRPNHEVAAALEISPAAVQCDWQFAKA